MEGWLNKECCGRYIYCRNERWIWRLISEGYVGGCREIEWITSGRGAMSNLET